jgi:hypothetical protein
VETDVISGRSRPPGVEPTTDGSQLGVGARRSIGVAGTAARAIVGVALLADVVAGHWSGDFGLGSWLLGLVGYPAVLMAWQWGRSRRGAPPLRATGPAGHLLNVGVFLALYLTFWYAPALSVTSDATLIFYGASMVLAAVRGYGGCEVLAVTNWLLRRDDQVGCTLFLPVDVAKRRR